MKTIKKPCYEIFIKGEGLVMSCGSLPDARKYKLSLVKSEGIVPADVMINKEYYL